jgi:hypothetical protein
MYVSHSFILYTLLHIDHCITLLHTVHFVTYRSMFRLIAIDFSQKSPHFSLLSPTSPCELSEREVTSPSNLKVVGALDNYSLVFVIFINFFGQLKD